MQQKTGSFSSGFHMEKVPTGSLFYFFSPALKICKTAATPDALKFQTAKSYSALLPVHCKTDKARCHGLLGTGSKRQQCQQKTNIHIRGNKVSI